jgi:pyruvate/2-oxoglutarate dehydrogenase complex dihydrolipoamide acyltransferase (E2) component
MKSDNSQKSNQRVRYKIQEFPRSRITTIDVCEIGKQKHYITALLQLDVSKSRQKIKEYNKANAAKISFLAWLISVISSTIKQYEIISSYLTGKNKRMVFEDINVSIVVEKDLQGQKVPIPLVIEKANEKSIETITMQIVDARNEKLTEKDIVLHKKTNQLEKIYFVLPGFIRRTVWRYLLRHPKLAFKKMGNVAFTAIGMIGKVNGWFIPASVHPICFGISSVMKKPVVIDDKIEIREMLNMTILIDHDVIDGAPMARFIRDLSLNIENGTWKK